MLSKPYEYDTSSWKMYNKPVTTIAQQIQQLKNRGLLISDDPAAEHFLSNISYYRLAGYWWPMQSDKVNHIFKPNSRFEDVIALYNFDRELRILHPDDLRFPPSIKTMEIATFGSLSRLYGNLKPTINSKDIIASELKTANHTYLHSWLQSISQIRNICAHHGRLWNKNLTIKPKLLSAPPAPWITNVPPAGDHHKLYIHACCLKYLLDVISPGHHYKTKLADLFVRYPSIDMAALGFNPQWQQEPLWA